MIKNITFEYADNIIVSDAAKQSVINNINMWLRTIEKEYNEAEGRVEVFFDKDSQPHIALENITEEFRSKVMEVLSQYDVWRR